VVAHTHNRKEKTPLIDDTQRADTMKEKGSLLSAGEAGGRGNWRRPEE